MTALLQQLPTLAGVVVGAAAAYAATVLGDRARFRREAAARWQDRRLAAYTGYARAQKRVVALCYRVAAQLGVDPHPHPLTLDDASAGLKSASDDRDLVWEELLLVGTERVVDAQRDWFAVVLEMEQFVRDGAVDTPRWERLLERNRATRARFYAAARADLALPPGYDGLRPVPYPTAASE